MGKQSPLHDRHVALGAKMADFGGWDMPIEYPGGGVVAEHTAVRERVGIFDVSHLGKAAVRGPDAVGFVNRCFTNDLRKIGPGQAQYTMCCNEAGGVVDDLIQYVKAEDDVFLIPNAANTAQVVRLLAKAAPSRIEVTDLHDSYGIIAVQGPKSDEVIEALRLPVAQREDAAGRAAADDGAAAADDGSAADDGLAYMAFRDVKWDGTPLIVCRTGYTGERGYELVVPWDKSAALWDLLVEAMAPHDGLPCGLGARDTLRTEMGYPLHGQDLSLDISPVQARAGWAVGWKKEQFWGREALLAEKQVGPRRISWGLLVSGRGIPRAHCDVVAGSGGEADSGGEVTKAVIGEVTSGTFSPTLKQGIALALLPPVTEVGDEVTVDVRGRSVAATVVKPPFVQTQIR